MAGQSPECFRSLIAGQTEGRGVPADVGIRTLRETGCSVAGVAGLGVARTAHCVAIVGARSYAGRAGGHGSGSVGSFPASRRETQCHRIGDRHGPPLRR